MTLAAKRIDGGRDCKASFKTGTAEVIYDPSKTTPEAIARVITETTGFKASAPKAGAQPRHDIGEPDEEPRARIDADVR